MINYVYKQKELKIESINEILNIKGEFYLFVVETNCVDDETVEYPNISGEVFLFIDKESALNAYNNILNKVEVSECSIFDISLSCYNIQKEDVEFVTINDVSDYYAEHMNSDNEIMSKRIVGKNLED